MTVDTTGSTSIAVDLPVEFVNLCASHKVKPETVLRGFIAGLCELTSYISNPRADGYSSNGSDERLYANRYYDRVGYPYWNTQENGDKK
jgi:hypothetical protein